uniref:hypothetical protein n=1 Tax=Microbacterium sp. CPCC 204701 TaxID=2493084 RepID=UPI0013E3BB0F
MTITLEPPRAEASGTVVDAGAPDAMATDPAPRTAIPDRAGIEVGDRRQVHSARLDDRYAILGAAAGALALAALL